MPLRCPHRFSAAIPMPILPSSAFAVMARAPPAHAMAYHVLRENMAPPFSPCQDGAGGLWSLLRFSLIRACPLGWFSCRLGPRCPDTGTASFLPIWTLSLSFQNMPEGPQVSMCVSAWGLSLGFPVQVRNSGNRGSRGSSQLMMDGSWRQILSLRCDLGILLCKF